MEGTAAAPKVEGKQDKKPRKRMKAILTKIREQLEFYFSDANLQKDRFLKKRIDETSDQFIDLDTFLNFNRIVALTTEVEILQKALSKSSFLQLNEEKTKVKRTVPFKEAKDVDDRTVYVECLPSGVDHDWVKRVFSACGKVVYVSLPKYRSTGDPKGFAFVEYDSVENAEKACEVLNNPPVEAGDQVGRFPKTSKTMRHLEKQLPDIGEDAGDKKTEVIEEGGDAAKSDEGKVSVKLSRRERKRQRHISECSTESSEDCTVKKKQKVSEPVAETTGVKGEGDSHSEPIREQRSKRKRQETEEVQEDRADKSKEALEGESKQKGEKRKSQDTSEDHSPPSKQPREDYPKEDGKKPKKKKNRNRKRKNKEKEVPEIRVISKHKWLTLRNEYITLQKANMAKLKQNLQSLKAKQESAKQNSADAQKSKVPKTQLEFVPGVIVCVKSENPLKRTVLRDQLSKCGDIAYLDVKDGMTSGHIRCVSAETASQVQQASVEGCAFTLLQGDEETQYWEKLKSDRLSKFNTQNKTKKRGAEKLIERGERAQANVIHGKHIVFADE